MPCIEFIITYEDLEIPKDKTIKYPTSKDLDSKDLIKWFNDNVGVANLLEGSVDVKGVVRDEIGDKAYYEILKSLCQLKKRIKVHLPETKLDRQDIEGSIKAHSGKDIPSGPIDKFDTLSRIVNNSKDLFDGSSVRINKARTKLYNFFLDETGKKIIRFIVDKRISGESQKDIADLLNTVESFKRYNQKPFNFSQVNKLYSTTTSFIERFSNSEILMDRLVKQRRKIASLGAYLALDPQDYSFEEKDLPYLAEESNMAESSPPKEAKKLAVKISLENDVLILGKPDNFIKSKRLLLIIYSFSEEKQFLKGISFGNKSKIEIDLNKEAKLFPGGYVYQLIDEDSIHFNDELFSKVREEEDIYEPKFGKFFFSSELYQLPRNYTWSKTTHKGKVNYQPLMVKVEEIPSGLQ